MLDTQEPLTEDPMIKAWSHSRLSNFESCKFRAKLLYVDKLEEPRGELKPGQTEYANDRGTRIHEAAELYVRGGVELIDELKDFREEFTELRKLFAQGKVSLEGDWAMDDAWRPTAWKSSDTWGRLKLDALVLLNPQHAVVIDYKSGRRSGNELKHAEQTQLYTVATLTRYPDVERITTELWYTDQNDLARVEYTRDQGMRFLKKWNERGLALTTCDTFPPNPNRYSCRFCHFGPKDGGPCTVGV